MRRMPWRSRPAGRHAAGPRGPGPVPRDQPGRANAARPAATGEGLLGAPTAADAAPLVSPVTDAARAAAADMAQSIARHMAPGNDPLVTIDALGRKCPIPIILLAQRIGEVPVGSVIAVLADDPAAYADIPAWCGLKSHECVYRVDHGNGWSFGIRRRY